MPKKIVITAYTFSELIAAVAKKKLPKSAEEKAREWLTQGATDGQWWDYTFDLWKSALSQIGFEEADIDFSGFWSQGDGASFTAGINVPVLLEFLIKPPAPKDCIDVKANTNGGKEDFAPYLCHHADWVFEHPELARLRSQTDLLSAQVLRTSSHYSHEATCHVDINYDDSIAAVAKVFEEIVEHLRRKLCRAIYRCLEEEYESITNDDALIDLADSNEYLFDRLGRRVC
jgi:hypothetical protein